MLTVKQLQACPRRATFICLSHELSAPSRDACMYNTLTDGDGNRLRFMTLGNSTCLGCVKLKSIEKIKQLESLTFYNQL